MTREMFGKAYENGGYQRTVRFLRSLGADRDTAMDVGDAAWAKGYERIVQLRDARCLVPWVNIIALNLFRDDRTSRKSTRQLLPEDEGIVSRAIDLRVLEMREALAKCTPRHQRILVAFHGEGYSIRDLAEQSCRSVRAVAAELYRARKELRGFMQVPRHVSSGEGVLRMKVQKQPRSEQASAA